MKTDKVQFQYSRLGPNAASLKIELTSCFRFLPFVYLQPSSIIIKLMLWVLIEKLIGLHLVEMDGMDVRQNLRQKLLERSSTNANVNANKVILISKLLNLCRPIIGPIVFSFWTFMPIVILGLTLKALTL